MSDIKKSHRGLLHRALGIPQGQKIPLSRLMAAKSRARSSGNTKLLKQVVYAENVRK